MANEESSLQSNGQTYQPLLSWCILGAFVDLLPEGQVVIGATVHVGLEWDTRNVVEHQE